MGNTLKTVLITQCRYGSSRLPGKILLKVGNETLLDLHLKRLKKSKLVDEFIVATTFEPESREITQIAVQHGFLVFQGSTEDVLDRFYQAARLHYPNYVVRITSDCPLIDPDLVDTLISEIKSTKVNYIHTSEDFPDGADVEVFAFSELENAWKNSTKLSDREHVTPYIRKHASENNSLSVYPYEISYSDIRMTVDELADCDLVFDLVNEMGDQKPWEEYAAYIRKNKSRYSNQSITRNEGYLKSILKDNSEENEL